MPIELRAALVVEIGSSTTRVTLVDAVDGEARLISQAAVPSSIEPPHENAQRAILDAAELLADSTGRTLVDSGALLMPQTHERDGVDMVVVVTSAAGQMALVIAAIASDISARSALHATRATYTSVLQTITLNDTAPAGAHQENAWIERQVQRLLGLRPDVVLIAGGLEDGAEDALVRLAHIVGLTAIASRVDSDGQQRQDITVRPVVFAGNSRSRDRVIESLSGRAEPRVVDNVRPSLLLENLEPARRELNRLYNVRILNRLPGLPALQRLAAAPVRTVCEATGLMTRFLSEQYGRNVLTADVGSASTALFLHSQERYSPAVLGGVGVGYGVGAVLAAVGPAAIARWLPFPIDEQDLVHRLLNKLLRPHSPPATREDALVDLAVAREALALAAAGLWDERGGASYDMLVASGATLGQAAHPGLALLVLLDALQIGGEESLLAVDVHLDTLGLLAACGGLAFANPDAALTLFERDLLRNTPLATCVVPLGLGRPGEPAVEAELQIVGGGQQRLSVAHGQIGRLDVPIGRKAQLVLRPAPTVRIGRNAPGAEVSTDVAAISGSLLGVVIDARGRPLLLPEFPPDRRRALWGWMVALGAESGAPPYEEQVPTGALSVGAPSQPPKGRDGPPTPPPEASGFGVEATLDRDLAKLRQTVEQPKKRRGLFGSKK